MGYEIVLDKLEELQLDRKHDYSGRGLMFECPAHDDRKASAHLNEGDDGRALVYCHAGCDVQDIVEGLGLRMGDLFEERGEVTEQYVYTDEDNKPLYRVLRYEPKGFSQERYEDGRWVPGMNGVTRVPYNLPAIKEATEVYLVEGEKDADALSARGYAATTVVGGASSWREEYSSWFIRKTVTLIPDLDPPGLALMDRVAGSLKPMGVSVRILHPAAGKDISDHFDAGLEVSQMLNPALDDAFDPVDWETYESPEVEWLYEPYVPRRGRVLVYGKAGSLKSLWSMWIASKLAQQGKRVAYFSLEMRPDQSVARLKKLRPPKSHFKLYTNYSLGVPEHRRKTIQTLRDFDLIVIDSWNSAHRFGRGLVDDQVAELDRDFFQPIIDGTGATLLIIDNTGHDTITQSGRRVESDHARGSSAKHDKMDVCIQLRRPDQDNNYLTEVHVTKMRYDLPIPTKELVVAPSEHEGIEFYYADELGNPEREAWEVPEIPSTGVKAPESPGYSQGAPAEALPGDDSVGAHVASAQESPEVSFDGLSAEDRLRMIQAERYFNGENDE